MARRCIFVHILITKYVILISPLRCNRLSVKAIKMQAYCRRGNKSGRHRRHCPCSVWPSRSVHPRGFLSTSRSNRRPSLLRQSTALPSLLLRRSHSQNYNHNRSQSHSRHRHRRCSHNRSSSHNQRQRLPDGTAVTVVIGSDVYSDGEYLYIICFVHELSAKASIDSRFSTILTFHRFFEAKCGMREGERPPENMVWNSVEHTQVCSGHAERTEEDAQE